MGNKILIVVIAVIIIITGLFFLIKTPQEESTYINLNEEKIECYENAVLGLFLAANITSDELNVQNVRCSKGELAYVQREINGTYFENNDHSKEPKSFYFHQIVGGVRSSGADTYSELCLIIENKIVISEIKTGRNLEYQSPARCSWQERL